MVAYRAMFFDTPFSDGNTSLKPVAVLALPVALPLVLKMWPIDTARMGDRDWNSLGTLALISI